MLNSLKFGSFIEFDYTKDDGVTTHRKGEFVDCNVGVSWIKVKSLDGVVKTFTASKITNPTLMEGYAVVHAEADRKQYIPTIEGVVDYLRSTPLNGVIIMQKSSNPSVWVVATCGMVNEPKSLYEGDDTYPERLEFCDTLLSGGCEIFEMEKI